MFIFINKACLFLAPFFIEFFLCFLIFLLIYIYIKNIYISKAKIKIQNDNFVIEFFTYFLFFIVIFLLYFCIKDISIFIYSDRLFMMETNNLLIKIFLLLHFVFYVYYDQRLSW